jgi:hypothetical protein
MTPMDPEVAAAVRLALGLAPGGPDPAGGLEAAACAVQAARAAAVMDGGSLVLTAVRMVWDCKAGGGTAEAARAAIAAAWPLATTRDVCDVLAALVTFSATWASEAQLAEAAAVGAGLP